MIISANRLSSINGRVSIGVNENYGSEDLGRIMMEDAMNDMAIFNAAVMQDMHEIKARQEGTMLESEIQAMAESGVNDFCKKVVDKLKAFWAKMKGWFKTAIANISAYIVRDGNAFVKMHLKDISKLSDDAKCGDRWVIKDEKGLSNLGKTTTTNLREYFNQNKKNVSDKSATELKEEMLKGIVGSDFENFYTALKEKYFEEVKDCDIKRFGKIRAQDALKNAKTSIGSMKDIERAVDDAIKETIKKAETAAKEALATAKSNNNTEQTDSANKKVEYIGNLSKAITAVASTVSKTGVKLVKFNLAECRKALATAIGRTARQESALLESLILEADEEIAELSDNDYASDLTPEEEEAVEAIVDAIEEKLSDDGDDNDNEE